MLKDGLGNAVLLAGIALVAALVLACGDDDDDGDQSSGAATGGVQEITISTSASQLVFNPDTVRVKAGQPVKLMFNNSEGTVLHDWSIEEMHVSDVHTEGGAEHMMDSESMDSEEMPMNDEDMHEMGMEGFALHVAADAHSMATIEFTPEEAGEYTFFCTVEGHRQAGMEGKLIVE